MNYKFTEWVVVLCAILFAVIYAIKWILNNILLVGIVILIPSVILLSWKYFRMQIINLHNDKDSVVSLVNRAPLEKVALKGEINSDAVVILGKQEQLESNIIDTHTDTINIRNSDHISDTNSAKHESNPQSKEECDILAMGDQFL